MQPLGVLVDFVSLPRNLTYADVLKFLTDRKNELIIQYTGRPRRISCLLEFFKLYHSRWAGATVQPGHKVWSEGAKVEMAEGL